MDSEVPPCVLIVDDDDTIRALLRTVFVRDGWQVLTASGGDEALAVAALGGAIHLLLSDVRLGGTEGPALYALLCESHPDLRALFVSGDSRESLVDHGTLDPASEFVQKPFAPQELVARARAVAGVQR